ncbi:helix-turn-helix domain-containing protein [Pseudomonas sp. LRP2-20]|uniref:GlxA family transcriptional regulator n=1 Tax=Pseudomonas sp. LRP2-20 TaxID=2944234 RepID=UPI0021887114|nr:helix-turn-helix domain-containing protein [Pseudomonas sp. LRP2-20]BDM22253.1 helix-turn-helix domain-containing protein [Pseudomonas sp. LRP2-20]
MHTTILVTDLCSFTSAHLALDFLEAANLIASQTTRKFTITIASLNGKPVYNSSGRELKTDAALKDIKHTDIVLIPGYVFSLTEAQPSFNQYSEWLKTQHAQGAFLASMCTSAFMLAEAGLLNEIEATTHWAFLSKLKRNYPGVCINEGRMVYEHNRIATSAGANAAVDLLLHIVRKFMSLEVALRCSEYFYAHPPKAQQSEHPFWALPKQHGDRAILQIQDWMEANLARKIVIAEICQKFGFGERNFKRRFLDATGFPPLSYLQLLRIEEAKRLLEMTEASIDAIINKIGYEDSNSFRRLFVQRVGLSPAKYRKKFRQ